MTDEQHIREREARLRISEWWAGQAESLMDRIEVLQAENERLHKKVDALESALRGDKSGLRKLQALALSAHGEGYQLGVQEGYRLGPDHTMKDVLEVERQLLESEGPAHGEEGDG